MTSRPPTVTVLTAGDAAVAALADRFTRSLTGARSARVVTPAASTELDAVARDVDILVVAARVHDGRLPADLTRLLGCRRSVRPVAVAAFTLCVAEPADHTVVEWQLKPALVASGLTCPCPGLTLPPRQDPAPAIAAYCRYWRFAVPGLVDWAHKARQVAA